MKLVIQRVERAQVQVDGEVVGEVARGVLVFLGVMRGDDGALAERMALKLARFRLFPGAQDRMDLSLLDTGGQALVVSQFTLAADGRKGRRPSFDRAAPPEEAEPLYETFVRALEQVGVPCATGRFGARMRVELVNDGPVTFVLEDGAAPGG